MASPTAERDRLDALDREIDVLDARLPHEEQEEHGVADPRNARAFITRQRILQKLHEHRKLARELLAKQCSAHGDAIYASCPDCVRIHRLDRRVA